MEYGDIHCLDYTYLAQSILKEARQMTGVIHIRQQGWTAAITYRVSTS